MAEARRIEAWNHTSALWFALRLIMTGLAGEKTPPDPLEIHPFKDQARAASPDAELTSKLNQRLIEIHRKYPPDERPAARAAVIAEYRQELAALQKGNGK